VSIDVRRADARFTTTAPGRVTRHSFSFGAHYDPANTSLGSLVCHNDDLVQPGFGYDDHPHRDLEIVTWVLSGALSHRDDAGRSGTITPGEVQVMSAGDGVVHSEVVEPGAGPTRFVQTWVLPDEPGGPTSYDSARVTPGHGWQPVASGSHPDSRTRLRAGSATLWVTELAAGQTVDLPDAPLVHLFVARGSCELAIGAGALELREADAVRLERDAAPVTAVSPMQAMAWTFADPVR
jgi:redox-sensitive bicupin YhaK (pirin superfamily)